MADKKQFSNTKSIVKVETGIVTLISYRHYLNIVGNNKLWPDMQKESWNIHLTKILFCSHTLRLYWLAVTTDQQNWLNTDIRYSPQKKTWKTYQTRADHHIQICLKYRSQSKVYISPRFLCRPTAFMDLL
jgi:hypothetical protein